MPINKLYEHPEKEDAPNTRVIAVDTECPSIVVAFSDSSPETLIRSGKVIGSDVLFWFYSGIDMVSSNPNETYRDKLEYYVEYPIPDD